MKLSKRFVACMTACTIACGLISSHLLSAEASNLSSLKQQQQQLQQQINQNQNALSQVNKEIDRMEAERKEYQLYLDDQKSEMINLMKDIAYYETAIEEKTQSIADATVELEAAMKLRDEQYDAMMVRIQYMYESGSNDNYLSMLLTSQGFTDFLNRAEYVDNLYAYDSAMLSDYEQLVAGITTMRDTLEMDKRNLEEEQVLLDEHKIELERIMAELEDTISDYNKLVADAEKKAKEYKTQIASGQSKIEIIKKQQEEEVKRQQLLAQQQQQQNNGGGSDKVVGTGTGAEVAEFALQYVGNPYVWGGTSLTNGADCSGFIMSVYAQFGYALPHSSFSMRRSGIGVSLEEAQAGDIICYSGHVAIYIGDGRIVHAKGDEYGIVTDPVYYGWGGTGPTVLAVRRIIN
ncbi:MAG: C40 family peptidase [Lachnospiraceae bacterium]|nr:C40 family peptidase [Lachnospiraceae bacterium]